jgi:hypothetical protein
MGASYSVKNDKRFAADGHAFDEALVSFVSPFEPSISIDSDSTRLTMTESRSHWDAARALRMPPRPEAIERDVKVTV